MAQIDFAYKPAYNLLSIDEHIALYGPQNRNRVDFAQTTADQHLRLFHEINLAIHNNPGSLKNIIYHSPGRPPQTLLTAPEVTHLTDVAHLIDNVFILGWSATILFIVLAATLLFLKAPLPNPKRVLLAILGALFVAILLILIIGPKKVFYYLHTWAFPPENPWFFYYQDSLMTTLMKAPDLFGFIAAVLLLVWTALWVASVYLLVRVWPRTDKP